MGYTLSQVQGIDDEGGVVGQVVNNKTLKFVAFTRSASGEMTLYAAPQSSSTWLYGRTAIGISSGFYQDSAHPEQVHGFQVQGGRFIPINYPKVTNTWLFNVNQLGTAVGSFSSSATLVRGFLLLNGEYTVVAYPEARTTYALAINDNSEIVGTYATGRVSNGFLWKDGNFTTINYPNSKFGTVLTGINNSGVVVGNHLTTDRDLGFILDRGEFKDVGVPDRELYDGWRNQQQQRDLRTDSLGRYKHNRIYGNLPVAPSRVAHSFAFFENGWALQVFEAAANANI